MLQVFVEKFLLYSIIYKLFISNVFKLAIFSQKHYSMIKELDGIIYVGGSNYLGRFNLSDNELIVDKEKNYDWEHIKMNGSFKGIAKIYDSWPLNLPKGPSSLSFDTCLNWKQEHKNQSMRDSDFDFHHWKYHTPSGNWQIMNFTCMNSFIRGIEKIGTDKLWVCGTFGAFPQAFIVNKTDLEFIKFLDSNVMSCARYMDEPMVTYKDDLDNIYVGSGWGLYRPDKNKPDVPNNNSTMLYADWRLYRNLYTMISAMAWVLSSDVNFINVVKNTADHLYFFGHEISNQYGLNNQEDRHAWQSFMLRICKKDIGFKYIPTDILDPIRLNMGIYYDSVRIGSRFSYQDFMISPSHEDLSYSSKWYDDVAHIPKTHFVTPLKINFGCYIGKRPRAISDNYFWGDTNVVYLNKLADVIFDPNKKIKFRMKNEDSVLGCFSNMSHYQIPLVGIFNREGLTGTSVGPTGALCQLQINENIFNEIGSSRGNYHKFNSLFSKNAYNELMALSSTCYSNFYSRSIHRTNGYTTYPYWNQGVLIGNNDDRPYYKNAFDHNGKCHNISFYQNMNVKEFLKIQNFSNTAWPNELPNRLTSPSSVHCQYSAAELYSFNATFIIPGVEFKKMFLIADNITDYAMSEIPGLDLEKRRLTSPLMIIGIISTNGYYYRVVLCDFDNAIANHGEYKDVNDWYNWCIFRHTDQPYLYRQYTPMERRDWGSSYQFRASSLLVEKRFILDTDTSSFPINSDPQFHIVKDVLRKGDDLYVLTATRFIPLNLKIECTYYSRCIDCASDPHCMWDGNNGTCTKYQADEYKKSKSNVQDVLDRGFGCVRLLTNRSTSNTTMNISIAIKIMKVLSFKCSNTGFWRGRIQWKVNDSDVFHNSSRYVIDSTGIYLTILNLNKNISNVSCYGIKEDHDRLFNNAEYSWINETYSSVRLMYIIDNKNISTTGCVQSPINYLWIITVVFLTLFNFLVLLVIFYGRRKRKQIPENHRSDTLHTPLCSDVELMPQISCESK